MTYGCFGYGMMGGNYGYIGIIFGWLIGILVLVGIVLLIIWIAKKIQNENHRAKRR